MSRVRSCYLDQSMSWKLSDYERSLTACLCWLLLWFRKGNNFKPSLKEQRPNRIQVIRLAPPPSHLLRQKKTQIYLKEKLIKSGVRIIQPDTVYIENNVKISGFGTLKQQFETFKTSMTSLDGEIGLSVASGSSNIETTITDKTKISDFSHSMAVSQLAQNHTLVFANNFSIWEKNLQVRILSLMDTDALLTKKNKYRNET